ncbi:glycosyltransferase family 2 protein, partial [bacterium]|nr:glycosyltransferase family 2 protein [bacterium]
MAFAHPALDALFLVTVAILWAMIFYQLFYTFLGYVFRLRAQREKVFWDTHPADELPGVTVLIPAHNEELVIEKTLLAIRNLNYPADRLEIRVINDGSTDRTAEIVERIANEDPRVILYNVPPEEAAQGKSHALNLGMRAARHEIVAVYDADNTPEPDSLRYLVLNLRSDDRLAGVFGKFRTRNRNRTLLTRFINIETLSFQSMIQGGRYLLFRIAILPGTNLVLRRSVIVEQGGWDEKALTEDTEFSIRLYQAGYEIKFVPYAVTWEEEPELWGTWLRQRTRWVRGNFYVLRKYLIPSFRFHKLSLTFEILHLFVLYYLFLISIFLSHFFFIAGALGWITVLAPGPYLLVWACAFTLFTAEILLAASYDDEATPANLALIVLMYFTYCQAWIVLVFR